MRRRLGSRRSPDDASPSAARVILVSRSRHLVRVSATLEGGVDVWRLVTATRVYIGSGHRERASARRSWKSLWDIVFDYCFFCLIRGRLARDRSIVRSDAYSKITRQHSRMVVVGRLRTLRAGVHLLLLSLLLSRLSFLPLNGRSERRRITLPRGATEADANVCGLISVRYPSREIVTSRFFLVHVAKLTP